MCKGNDSTRLVGDDKIKQMEDEINALHSVLENRGINSRGTTDIFGRPFALPVNSEHKATIFNGSTLLSAAQPHMRVFWAATFGFFTTFFSVFAPAALGPWLRMDRDEGGLALTKEDISLAGNVAVSGTIVMRVFAGSLCDLWGARKTFIFLLLLGVPGMIILICAQSAAALILGRFLIGLSLATFVTCQVWCSQFFERRIVGTVNATAGGWGNLGGGITLLIMPVIMEAFMEATADKGPKDSVDTSWRLCIIIPLAMHIIASLFIMTGRDLADGSYKELETSGAKQKSSGASTGWHLALVGFSNTNALIMLLTYGLCFGVELTMNNKLVGVFSRYYAVAPRSAGQLGAVFSLMNLFARSWGGILSDAVAVKYGIRGRITAMWVIQMLEGLMCLLLGCVTMGMDNPDSHKFKGADKIFGIYVDNSGLDPVTYYTNSTFEKVGNEFIPKAMKKIAQCGSKQFVAPKYIEHMGEIVRFPANGRIMVYDENPDCIHNGNTLGVTMVLVIIFSLFVQMAEGLHFGIVPYISRPALGVVSGMVGAGGNMGAVIGGQFIVGSGKDWPLDEGMIYLGIVIMALTCTMLFIFFPGEGGIFLPPNFPYDPQWIKPKEGAKGSDQLDFTSIKSSTTAKEAVKDASSAA